jgi:hypothetical protein
MDKINNAVIIALNFIKKVNGFEKQGKTEKTRQ